MQGVSGSSPLVSTSGKLPLPNINGGGAMPKFILGSGAVGIFYYTDVKDFNGEGRTV